jgi:hypothetical protein
MLRIADSALEDCRMRAACAARILPVRCAHCTACTATRACRTADPERGTVTQHTTEVANGASGCDMLLLCHAATRPARPCAAVRTIGETANRVRSFTTLSAFAPKVGVYDG